MGKFETRIDVSKNRMILKMDGFFSDEELKKCVDEIFGEIEKLRPGFDIINDITGFKPASPKGAKEMLRAQSVIKEKGMGKIIRVVGSSVLGKKQFDRNAKQVGYSAETAPSIEAAEKMLGG